MTKEELFHEYIELGHERNYIAEKFGITKNKVAYLLQRYDIKRKARIRHGLYGHPINKAWNHMKSRCYNPKSKDYKWYGARGIKVCDEWKNNFMNFYEWSMNNGWKEGYEINRIDNDGNYSPDNCKWISHKNQCRNRNSNRFVTVDGETKLMCEWAEIIETRQQNLSKRKKRHGEKSLPDYIKERLGSASQSN